jgi:aminoglycoside phosphotransferase (APT) family kinase protein
LWTKIELRDAPNVHMHANQLTVSVDAVHELVDQQFPEWRGLPIKAVVSRGTVNALFLIGDEFALGSRWKLGTSG